MLTIAAQLTVLLLFPIAVGAALAYTIDGWLSIRDLRRQERQR